MGHVIEGVNSHFGTDFKPFGHTEEAVAAVRSGQGYHAGPNDRRDRLKEETRADFDEVLQTNASLRNRMDAAKELFASYVKKATVEATIS